MESALTFACRGETLLGVLSQPSGPTDTCLLIIVGGPQTRVGSHRLFVQLARGIADAGIAALRFDVRGMGDSTGAQRSFEDIGDDIRAAIDAAQRHQPAFKRFVLWGLCDGASAALMVLGQRPDPRITGLCLVNPWVRSVTSEARTRVKHYYLQRLQQKDFWLKLFSGKVAGAAVGGLARSALAAFGSSQSSATGPASADEHLPYQDRMAQGWAAFSGPTLLVLSGNDYTAKEFVEYTAGHPRWQPLLARPAVRRLDFEQADHTLSKPADKARLLSAMREWLHAPA